MFALFITGCVSLVALCTAACSYLSYRKFMVGQQRSLEQTKLFAVAMAAREKAETQRYELMARLAGPCGQVQRGTWALSDDDAVLAPRAS